MDPLSTKTSKSSESYFKIKKNNSSWNSSNLIRTIELSIKIINKETFIHDNLLNLARNRVCGIETMA